MKRFLVASVLAVASSLAPAAESFTATFSASSFVSSFGSLPPPQLAVEGAVTWIGEPGPGQMTSLVSIDLVIAGHIYGVSELEFFTFPGTSPQFVVGGSSSGPLGVLIGSDDFILLFNAFGFMGLSYTTDGIAGSWAATEGQLVISQVPELPALPMAVLGLLVVLFSSRAARSRD